jgi:hypothetical protein
VRPETDSHWTPAASISGLFPDNTEQATPPVAKAAPPEVPRKAVPTEQSDQLPAATPVTSDTPPGVSVRQAVPVADISSTTPVATPVAKPVVQPAPRTATGPTAIPVATPVSETVPASTGVDVVPPRPPHEKPQYRSGQYARHGRGKSQSVYLVVGGLLGVFVVLVAVAIIVFTRNPPRDKPQVIAESKHFPDSVEPDVVPVDPETDPYADVQVSPSSDGARREPFPALGRWLDATRQKGGLRGIVRLGVSDAWLEKTESGERILNIRVDIGNLKSDSSLDFRGWSGRGGASARPALLADERGNILDQVPAEESGNGGRATVRRIKPNETFTEVPKFSLGDNTSSSFRLALPYASLGYTGYLGFEIPVLMIKDHPPGAEVPGDAAPAAEAEAGTASERAAGGDAAIAAELGPDGTEASQTAESEGQSGDGRQPATIKDLKRSIEQNASDAAEEEW